MNSKSSRLESWQNTINELTETVDALTRLVRSSTRLARSRGDVHRRGELFSWRGGSGTPLLSSVFAAEGHAAARSLSPVRTS